MSDASRKEREAELPVAIGDLVDNKYRVDRVLGAGGMGVVAVATHVELGQQVALKFLLPRALKGGEARQRFLREARAAVRLKSEHVARVFDVGALPTGEPFTVMEYLDGSDLAAYAQAHAPMRVAEAVEFVLQACEAIVEAHSVGIVHRDLKPHNLFITKRVNGAPLVKVLDFGISKALGPAGSGDLSLTDSTAVLGSPLYMAPEQMKAARNADARSDIWSLGVILYELLTSKVPFDGESMTELCLKVVNDPPPPPRALRGDLPDALAAVVLRCLEKDPADRFQNVGLLAEALESFSTSGRRPEGERAWRSLVDTADAMDVMAPPATPASPAKAPAITPPHARTDVSWEDTQESASHPPPSRTKGQRRAVFIGGLSLGVAATVVVFAVAFLGMRGRGRTTTPATPSVLGASESIEPAKNEEPAVAPTSTPSATPSATPTTTPSAAASAAPSATPKNHAKHTEPARSAKAPEPPPTPTLALPVAPNGAPILH